MKLKYKFAYNYIYDYFYFFIVIYVSILYYLKIVRRMRIYKTNISNSIVITMRHLEQDYHKLQTPCKKTAIRSIIKKQNSVSLICKKTY